MDQYINHSGGADGADKAWKDLGKPHGVKTVDWRPHHAHISAMTHTAYDNMLVAVENAAKALGRPHQFKGVGLVHRNWFQAHHATAVYAIGYIIAPGEEDYKGFMNGTGKEIVSGGTGWAVEMAIQMGKPVYVYDMEDDCWKQWMIPFNKFFSMEGSPNLTKTFAGIGSRIVTPEGFSAIEEIYKKTFNHESRN